MIRMRRGGGGDGSDVDACAQNRIMGSAAGERRVDDLLTRFEQIPAGPGMAALGGLLTLSLFGVPWFGRPVPEALADRGSLHDRWKLFAWLHPALAALLRAALVLVVLAGLSSLCWSFWVSPEGTAIRDSVSRGGGRAWGSAVGWLRARLSP